MENTEANLQIAEALQVDLEVTPELVDYQLVLEKERLEAHGLAEYSQKLIAKILDGWSIDFESNEDYPIFFGTYMTVGIHRYNKVKVEDKQEAKVDKPVRVKKK